MKILLLPLFSFPTGHTKVADAMREQIERVDPTHEIEMVDLLRYTNPLLEKAMGSFYIKWIHVSPRTYQWMYEKNVSKKERSSVTILTRILERKMLKLIREKQPDLIFCTHAFPSSILNTLKEKGKIDVPVVNVYTDFFLNEVWGRTKNEYHIVPHEEAKAQLLSIYPIPEEHIFVTGIPIRPAIHQKTARRKQIEHVLLSGGSIGFLDQKHFTKLLDQFPKQHFYVLCGNNDKLKESIQALKNDRLVAIPYLETADDMNALYDTIDLAITKPGGVTMSELIYKEIPFFVDHFLPGPEEINYHLLNEVGITALLTDENKDRLMALETIEAQCQAMREWNASIDETVPEVIRTLFKKM